MSFPYNSLGLSYYKMGDYNKSLKFLKKAISINRLNYHCHNNLGNTLKDQGKFDEAIEGTKKLFYLTQVILKHTTIWEYF